jgi:hypothetical protein
MFDGMIHSVPLSVFADILTAIFGFLFLLFFIAVASVIVLGLVALKALPYVVGFAGGFLSTLAEADDAGSDHTTGGSSRKEGSASTGTGSNAPGSQRTGTVGSDGGNGPYETNEYGELVEEK